MINKKINRINIYQFANLLKYDNIFHFITTRNNGVSPEPFKSLNLGYKSGDNLKNVSSNWDILKNDIGLMNTKTILLNQVHSDKVIIINSKPVKSSNQKITGDAIITAQKGLLIAVLVADCVPIILYDPNKSVIGVVHAGWRGSSLEIAKKSVRKMKELFFSEPKDIIAGIGPSIGPCCYKVKSDVAKHFTEYKSAVINKKNRYYIDLWEINRFQLIESGINEDNIEIAGLCTSCNNELFFSYRKQNPTGRFALGVIIK